MKRIRRAYSKTVSLIDETAVQIYQSFVGKKKGFLLESYDKNNGRYVFMGKNPEEVIKSKENGLVIEKADGTTKELSGNPVDLLKGYYSDFEIRKDDEQLAFTGGLVGGLGYDFVRYKEELPDNNPDEIGISTISLMLVTEFLSIDHFAETMTAVVVEDDTEAGREKAMFRGEEMVKEAFANGHVFQTVLSQRWTIETKQKGFDLYKELREINPSPYMYYFNFEEFEIIGSSPEMIVKQKDNKVLTCPIAGTRPRGKDDAEDQKFAEGLMKDPKEKAEHVMLVDLARNDMGRIAEFGTVKVRDFMHIQKYSHVMHIVSLVEGRKKGEYHPLDLVNAFLPAGTLSGAPKVRAMEIIDELESVRRGLYGGAIGYIDFNGDMDFCITIRTMIKKADKVYIQAGAGIVADSNPESEYNECCNKARALAKVLVP